LHYAFTKGTDVKTHFKIQRTLFSAAKKYAFTIALIVTLAIGVVAQTITFPSDGNAGVGTIAPPTYECEGNACSVVTLTWEEDGQRFRVENSSDRRVKIEVATFEGSSSITVEAHKSDYLQVKYFNGPYHANYE
jgi:hypothetical protein